MNITPSRLARVALVAALSLIPLAAPCRAGEPTFIDTFTGGVNQGGWLFFDFPTGFTDGGNPGAWIGATVNQKELPQATSSGASVFMGDFRMRNVTSLGIDLLTESTGVPQVRPMTFIIGGLNCSVFVVGPELVPMPGEGWRSYDVSFDPQSPTLPAGWQTFSVCGDPDATWNHVIQNVAYVGCFWGDPLAWSSYTKDDWVLGVDNPRITEQNPWLDLGGASQGTAGKPKLLGSGLLGAGTSARIDLVLGPPNAPALIWLASPAAAPFPAVGGTLHALPSLVQVPVVLSPFGKLSASGAMPPAAAGTELTFQILCKDAGTPSGVVLSNAVRGTVP